MDNLIKDYISNLNFALHQSKSYAINNLAQHLKQAWTSGNTIYICGNGGSAGNAIHLANDLIYGAGVKNGRGLRVEALTANSSVLTCLANDIGYEKVFSEQIRVKGNKNDLLLVFSGSGNSQNLLNAIEAAHNLGMISFAVLGYDGGKCKTMVHFPIHFEVNDMQISEDLQLIVGHICMKWLSTQTIGAQEL